MSTTHRTDGTFMPGTHWRQRTVLWSKEWCAGEYTGKQRSAKHIAAEIGVTQNAVYFWLHKHGIPRRSMSDVRKVKRWGASGSNNPMWGKSGALNPHWLGGISPERQAFYETQEWKAACSTVWKRDKARCRRCRSISADYPLHVHHIQSFKVVAMRAKPSNLVLLCKPCHTFVHSRRNTQREYL